MLLETSSLDSSAVLGGQPQTAPRADRRRYLRVDFRLRNYEWALIIFGVLYAYLITRTHLPLSTVLLRFFLINVLEVTAAVYLCAIPLVLGRVWLDRRRRGRDGTGRATWLELSQPYLSLDFLVRTVRRGLVIFGAIYFFLHLKHLILWLNPVNHDLALWDLDRRLHFGIQPNIRAMELISPHQEFAVLLDWLYIEYFHYKLLVSTFFLLEIRGRKLSDAFFFAYAMLWFVGGLGYLIYPADGPCFAVLGKESIVANDQSLSHPFRYPIVSVDPNYAQQYADSKIWTAKGFQLKLWTDRQQFLAGKRLPGVFYGIAAMPSLHVAAVTMIAIFVFKASVVAGAFAALYVVITFIGSIFLQWHYAVDGYVGFLMAVVVSVVALWLPDRRERGVVKGEDSDGEVVGVKQPSV